MPRLCSCLLAVILALAGLAPAAAQTFEVKQPEAKKGEWSFETNNSFQMPLPFGGDGYNHTAHEFTAAYGVTDYWKLTLGTTLERPALADPRFATVGIQSLLVLMKAEKHGLGLGWFNQLDVSTHHETTNATLFGPIIRFEAGKLSLTLNPFFEKTFGRNAEEGLALVYGWQLAYQLTKDVILAIESNGKIENLGDPPPIDLQEHRIGPVISASQEISDGRTLTIGLGLLFGLTAATPDRTVKFQAGITLDPPGKKAD